MLLPVEAAQPRALDVHLASMEGDLAVGFPPAVRLPLPAPRMAGTTDRLRIVIHHLAKSLQAGSQAERLKARKNVRQRLKLQRSRRNRSRCSNLVHGVAFLCGISTPSLSAQGQQRRSSISTAGGTIPFSMAWPILMRLSAMTPSPTQRFIPASFGLIGASVC